MRLRKRLHYFIAIAILGIVGLSFMLKANSNDQSSAHIRLVSLILTAPDHYDQRSAVRDTWIGSAPSTHKHYFFIAAKGLEPSTRQLLVDEDAIHHDLVLLPNAVEVYDQLTTKVLRSFQWIHEHYPNAQHVFKGDDDTFVRADLLSAELESSELRNTTLYWGYFDGRAPVRRSGKWEEKTWFLCDRYLPYALGGGYVLSMSLVQYLAEHADAFQKFKSEDVSVGLWLAPFNITRKHDVRFDTEWKSRGCSNQHLVMHKQTPVDMYNKHEQWRQSSGQRVCVTEETRRHAYEYRWDLPASQCCPGRGMN
eukprot:m.47182 g.47182  ORF g.47182 m.47182 type:complete len:309 (-) comp13207_c0_seq2:501-1427(-)